MSSARNSSKVELEPVAYERAGVLEQLFQLYAHDFSEQLCLRLAETGRFEVSAGERAWTHGNHHAFFVRAEGRLAGFALARRGSLVGDDADTMDVDEFFVVRGERRKRVGQLAAQALFARFPGRWEVRVRHSNSAAFRFWTSVLEPAKPALDTFHANGVDWHLFRALLR